MLLPRLRSAPLRQSEFLDNQHSPPCAALIARLGYLLRVILNRDGLAGIGQSVNIELQHSPAAFEVDDVRLLIYYGLAHNKSEL